MRFTRRIMAAKALARFEPEEFRPGPSAQSDEELANAAGELGTTIFHPVGTCKMGRDDMAVVDDRLRVQGVEGLSVIDASIMPRITSGNTNAPAYVIAEKGGAMILEDRRRFPRPGERFSTLSLVPTTATRRCPPPREDLSDAAVALSRAAPVSRSMRRDCCPPRTWAVSFGCRRRLSSRWLASEAGTRRTARSSDRGAECDR